MNEHTSQGLSERLRDKGFRGEHEIVWIKTDGEWIRCNAVLASMFRGAIPAYTFSELWAVMPSIIPTEYGDIELDMYKEGNSGPTICVYWDVIEHTQESTFIRHESPAEAIGEMLIWLIENNYYEVNNAKT